MDAMPKQRQRREGYDERGEGCEEECWRLFPKNWALWCPSGGVELEGPGLLGKGRAPLSINDRAVRGVPYVQMSRSEGNSGECERCNGRPGKQRRVLLSQTGAGME